MQSLRLPPVGPVPRSVLRLAALLVLVVWSPSAVRAQGKSREGVAGRKGELDGSSRPGNDFFGYANESWLKATTIPAGKDRWGARNEIDGITRQQIAKLLAAAGTEPVGSTARKVADFRAAYLNEAAIEGRGIRPLQPALDSIDQVQDREGLTRLLGQGMRADVDPLNWGVYQSAQVLGLSVEPGINGEKSYVPFLLQGGLGLGDRGLCLDPAPPMQALRTRYQEYIGRMLALAGFDRATDRAAGVMALESALALRQATKEASANDRNADHLWTRDDFAREAPGMDWSIFFTAAGLAAQESFVAWQPGAVKGVAALIASEPLEVWKDYLRFHLLDAEADLLPRAFADEARALHEAATPAQMAVPREQRALDATELALGDAIGKMYAERYFPSAEKVRVEGIVANVAAAFIRRVERASWMAPATRAEALVKLRTLYVGIGYPDQWQDYSDLVVDPLDPVGNLRRVAARTYRRALAQLGRPVDRHQWWIAPQTVGAILVFQQNEYDFTAALLQAPKFDPAASDAANYGAIGAIIGHDISHFVDRLGAEYDTAGRERRWWTPEDTARFGSLVQPLVDQFSSYHPFPELAIDGKLTATENIADLAGLSAAFDAYRRTLGVRAADTAYVRRQDREFFLGFARSWRSKLSEGALRTQLTNDHAPERYRVATVRNLDAWYDAFDVRPGDRLYLPPQARVRIW